MGHRESPLADHCKTLFFQGRYLAFLDAVLEEPVDTSGSANSQPEMAQRPELWPYMIGALSFVGRLSEAEKIFRHPPESRCADDETKARFFLSVGFCRHSKYEEALALLIENYRVRHQTTEPQSKFYLYQGFAFFQYFAARFQTSYRFAERARAVANQTGFLYGKVFANDLSGYSLVKLGKISKGLTDLDRALLLAKRSGNKGTAESISISIAILRAQFVLCPDDAKLELQACLETLQPENNYSRAELLLELAQQSIRQAQLSEGSELLDEASVLILGSEHKRYNSLLRLRLAEIAFLQGETALSSQLLNGVEQLIHPKMDRDLLRQTLQLKLRVWRNFGGAVAQSSLLQARLRSLESQLCRQDGHEGGEHAGAQRRVGESDAPVRALIDRISANPALHKKEAIESGLFFLIFDALELASRKSAVLDLTFYKRGAVLFEKGETRVVESGLSELLGRFIRCVASGGASKERLIQEVWGYRYDPLTHDSLIYQTAVRLRALLGKFAPWFELTEMGYQFRADVNVRLPPEAVLPEAPAVVTPEVQGELEQRRRLHASLNFRQLEILKYLKDHQNVFIDVDWCVTNFSVSDMTSRRDLRELVDRNMLVRSGRARATRYSMDPGLHTQRSPQ